MLLLRHTNTKFIQTTSKLQVFGGSLAPFSPPHFNSLTGSIFTSSVNIKY